MNDEPGEETRPALSKQAKWGLTGLAIVAAGGAGMILGGQGEDVVWPEDRAPKTQTVAATNAAAPKPQIQETLVRGVINPSSESTIASRMTARIIAMPYGEGQAFPAGALLASFDCSTIRAELKAAQAAAQAYRKTYETNVELDQYEAVGKNEVAVSQANLGKANAEANAVSAQLADCAVRAPFSGKVVEQLAHAREVAASGQPLLKIQSGTDVEIELIVPSNWLTWLEPGATFAFAIDETAKTIKGRVKRFGASVDPVSKTIRVIGVVTETQGLVLAGMSGTAIFDDPRARGEAQARQGANGQPS